MRVFVNSTFTNTLPRTTASPRARHNGANAPDLPYRDTLTKTVSGSTGAPFFRISK